MARTLKFTIPGPPVPKPRQTRSDVWRKPPRPCVARYRAWADLARLKAREAGGLPEPDRISLITCRAFFQPPKSWSKKKQESVIGKPHRAAVDADNALKAAGDALFKEDKGLSDLAVVKRWDLVPRVEIEIEYEE